MEEGVGFQNLTSSCYLGVKSRKRSKYDFWVRFIQQFTKKGGFRVQNSCSALKCRIQILLKFTLCHFRLLLFHSGKPSDVGLTTV